MPMGEPFISAICDKCDEVTDPMSLTMLAGGGWDDRNIRPKLKRLGWHIDGHKTICPDCKPEPDK